MIQPYDIRAADHTLRRAVRLVVVLNLAYFGIEFAVARAIGSISLFADSIDFLEDASINFLDPSETVVAGARNGTPKHFNVRLVPTQHRRAKDA
jgi:Co/Zn/Cd efflux system component